VDRGAYVRGHLAERRVARARRQPAESPIEATRLLATHDRGYKSRSSSPGRHCLRPSPDFVPRMMRAEAVQGVSRTLARLRTPSIDV